MTLLAWGIDGAAEDGSEDGTEDGRRGGRGDHMQNLPLKRATTTGSENHERGFEHIDLRQG